VSAAIAIALIASGVAVGFSSALFGVGGGILMVPLLVLAFGKTQHLAEGTSLLVIVPTAISGVLAQRRARVASFRHAGVMAAGGVGGAYLGAALAQHLPHKTLQMLFGALLLISGIRVLRSGLRLRGSRRPEVGDASAPVQLEASVD
jgi:uncharacterized membrane protein YfcA